MQTKKSANLFILLLAELPVWFLFLPMYTVTQFAAPWYSAFSVLVYAVGCYAAYRRGYTFSLQRLNHPALSAALCLFFGSLTYLQFLSMDITQKICAHLHISIDLLTVGTSALAAVCGIPGMDFLITQLLGMPSPRPSPIAKERKPALYLLLSAVCIITFATHASPLYPMNGWNDVNIFYTIGRGILKGLVPYRDLIDIKGPILYMLYALGGAVNAHSFFGVYLLEILFCFAFLWLTWLTLREVCGETLLLILPILAALLYSAPSATWGGSAESFCMPLIAYTVYVGTKALRKEQLPTRKEFFWIGFTSGAVLWMKYTMLAFYIGWILAPTLLAYRKKQLPRLFQGIGCIVLGVAAVTAIPFGYLLAVGGLSSLFEVYFYDVMFVYAHKVDGSVLASLKSFWESFLDTCFGNFPAAILLLLGTVWCRRRENRWVFWTYLLSLIPQILVSCVTSYGLVYYAFILTAQTGYGIALVWELCNTRLHGKFRPRAAVSLLCATAIIACIGYNRSWLFMKKSDLAQYQFAEIIDAYNLENPTLINYGFMDEGFYFASGILPVNRFFSSINFMDEERSADQTKGLDDGTIDFVVTKYHPLERPDYTYVTESNGYTLYVKTALLPTNP